ncbi:MAG: methyltransferase type 11 [Bacillus thermozeamaize]|jgi:ubiquinone/menaquinone biosynthesis C-methylase UbiE|uniref:Methyltransferase type 11 n=1 Tax=Bacillus thermozeamaize TaxID=230954 RepID=A0A1Y3PKK8_9BACI|nr:MAG: methyltransferase type 11 [Bacillus thermozeamaize]
MSLSWWFPKLYDHLMEPLERSGLRRIRQQLLKEAQGKVLEIGSGTGANFPFYDPVRVQCVIAVEPAEQMRRRSLAKIEQAAVPVDVVAAGAENLPFPDAFFDTVVGTLVFCTIPDPEKALQEVRRVCKPGGKVLIFEHVRLESPFLARLQDLLTPVWKRLCDGCHLNRNTLQLVRRSGLQVKRVESFYRDLFLVIEAVNPPLGH